MRIGILRIGPVDLSVLERIRENLSMAFPKAQCKITPETLNLPQKAFDKIRKQYRSDVILSLVKSYAEKATDLNRVLGVVDVDIYVPGLNFVFGEAECRERQPLYPSGDYGQNFIMLLQISSSLLIEAQKRLCMSLDTLLA